MKKINQKGFGAIEAVLILVIVGIIGGVGYYIYNANKKTDDTFSAAAKLAQSSPNKVTKKTIQPTSTIDPVLYSDSTGTFYAIAALAKTSDQKNIAAVLDAKCQSLAESGHKSVAGTGAKDLFTNNDNFIQSGNFAVINTGCYDKTSGSAPWGNAAKFYTEKNNGKWVFVTAGQGQTDCSSWDGSGVPSGIVAQCYDHSTNTSRAPKP